MSISRRNRSDPSPIVSRHLRELRRVERLSPDAEQRLAHACFRALVRTRRVVRRWIEKARPARPAAGRSQEALLARMSSHDYAMYLVANHPVAHLRRHAGEEAAQDFRRWWSHHLPLAFFLAARVSRRFRIDLEDLLAPAYMGLMMGLARYDPGRGVQVSTYVQYWIVHAMNRSRSGGVGIIRVPWRTIGRIRRFSRRGSWQRLTGAPVSTDAELLREEGSTGERAAECLAAGRVAAHREWLSIDDAVAPSALASHLGLTRFRVWSGEPDDDHFAVPPTVGETVPDENVEVACAEADAQVEQALLADALTTLLDFERRVLALRYFNGEKPPTFKEIGRACELSGERIRQIERRACEKLKRAMRRARPDVR